jgi:hypothetical protein
MKYTVHMRSGAMIYIPSFIKIGSGIQNLRGVTHREEGDCISLLWASRLIILQLRSINLLNSTNKNETELNTRVQVLHIKPITEQVGVAVTLYDLYSEGTRF